MADLAALTFAGGLAMGVASSLHCAAMCGGVGAAMMFAFSPGGGAAARARALMTAQAGRATGYVLAGAAAGGAGASVVGSLDHGGALLALRVASAAMLVWIGLSTLGLVRSFALADRAFGPILAAVRSPGSSSARVGAAAPFVAGLGWSLTPCALVLGPWSTPGSPARRRRARRSWRASRSEPCRPSWGAPMASRGCGISAGGRG
jgi:sulfite exporter TauE/SafE